ncbi:MAG: hypothetical protein J0L78_01890 [Planctomycetes bacterium]|nr:hypothetical protein [Planctomycetota bacterium]
MPRIEVAFVLSFLIGLAFPSLGQQAIRPAQATKFLDAAKTVTASIQEKLFLEQSGLYAQSLEKREPEFMWGNGVMFSALVAAARHDPETYMPVMNRFFTAMDRYWDAKSKIPGYEPAPTSGNGNDKYYDDNQWMVIAFMEAYDLTQDEKFLNRADETLKFSLSGWDDQLGGGIWWHEQHKDGSKNTCANGPAAVGCLRVARARDTDANVKWAHKIAKWTTEHLQDRDGLFFDNQKVADGKIDKTKWTYNTALMIRAYLGLWRATGDTRMLAEAKRVGAASNAFVRQKTGAYRDGYKFTHLLVEADLEFYRATGDQTILARAKKNGEAAWAQWQASPPKEMIEQAGIARMLWLLADHETDVGREFWKKSDLVTTK